MKGDIVLQLSRILHSTKEPPSGKGSREMYESTQISREHQMRVSMEPYFYCPQHSCGKVMFLHVSVILSKAGGCLADTPQADNPPPADTRLSRHPRPPPPQIPPSDGHCSGWYASYWNAFMSSSVVCGTFE